MSIGGHARLRIDDLPEVARALLPDRLGLLTRWEARSRRHFIVRDGLSPRVRLDGSWRPIREVFVNSRSLVIGMDGVFLKVHADEEVAANEVFTSENIGDRYRIVRTSRIAPSVTSSDRASGTPLMIGRDPLATPRVRQVISTTARLNRLGVGTTSVNVVEFARLGESILLSCDEAPASTVRVSETIVEEPALFSHGDLTPANIFFAGDLFSLIDLEHGGWYPYYFDACHFVLRMVHLTSPEAFDAGFVTRSICESLSTGGAEVDRDRIQDHFVSTAVIMLGRELTLQGFAATDVADLPPDAVRTAVGRVRRMLRGVGLE